MRRGVRDGHHRRQKAEQQAHRPNRALHPVDALRQLAFDHLLSSMPCNTVLTAASHAPALEMPQSNQCGEYLLDRERHLLPNGGLATHRTGVTLLQSFAPAAVP